MKRAGHITENASDAHLRNFKLHMRAKFGLDGISLHEPYLPAFLMQREIELLKSLEQLFDRLDRTPWPLPVKSALPHAPRRLEYIAIDARQPLLPQVEDRLDSETFRYLLRLHQGLDKRRQQAIGIKKYIWRAARGHFPNKV